MHHGARERRALLLAARQRDAALADHRVVALRKIGDVLVEARDRRRRRRSLGVAQRPGRPSCRDLASRPNATLSASVSEKRNGSCGTNPIAPRSTASGMSRTSTPSTNTVPGGGSCSRAQQVDQRRLARSGGADERHGLPGLDARDTCSSTGRRAP